MQLPKNVMQYGEIDSHIKIYMEDYVHTFLEQSKRAEVYLVFGKKEDRGEVSCYMIYGVERKSDWDRGNYPYFKKYERLGTLDGPADRRIFRPTRGNSVALDGYFVFYEQNEDMQSYMITVKERDSIPGSEEKEEVMEAVRLRRELRRQGDGGNQERKDGRKDVGAEGGQIGTEQAATAERKDMAVRNAAERGEAERGAFAEKIAMEMKERHRTKKEDRAEQRKRAAVFGRRQKEYERNGTQSFRSRTAFSKSAGKSAKILQRAEKRVHRNGPVRIPKTIKRNLPAVRGLCRSCAGWAASFWRCCLSSSDLLLSIDIRIWSR